MVGLTMAGMAIATPIAVGYPLRRYRQDAEVQQGSDELARRKASIYQDIKELEFDLETGKVARAEYESMRAEYETEAALLLEAMDREGNGREPAGCPACGMIPESGARYCPACGKVVAETDRFCGGGAVRRSGQLEREKEKLMKCPACGAQNLKGVTFCTNCGTRQAVSSRPINKKMVGLAAGGLILGLAVAAVWQGASDRGGGAAGPGVVSRAFGLEVQETASKFFCGCGTCEEPELADCTCPTAVEEKTFIEQELQKGTPRPEVIRLVHRRYGKIKPQHASLVQPEDRGEATVPGTPTQGPGDRRVATRIHWRSPRASPAPAASARTTAWSSATAITPEARAR